MLAQVTDAFPRSSEPSAPSLSVCARSCLPIPRYGTPTWCFGRAVRTTSPRFATSTPNPTPGVGWDGALNCPTTPRRERTSPGRPAHGRTGPGPSFRIADADSDQVIGSINLRFGEHDTAEISYFLRTSARGRGIATRAVRLVVRWAFEDLGIERIELRVHPDNTASRRVAERVGFAREGVERASRAWPDGTRFDSIVFSLLATDP